MSNSKANVQDQILNAIRKQKVEIILYLTNGVPLRGRITSFDNFTLILENENKQNLVYKHAISTVAYSKSLALEDSEKKGKSREDKEEKEKKESEPNSSGEAEEKAVKE